MEVLLSSLSALFTVFALGMFAYAILKRQSQPYLLAWVIRISLVAVAFLSQLAGGASYSLALSGSQLLGGIVIIGLITYTQPRLGRLGRFDWLSLSAAGVGVAVWILSGNPLYGLLGVILADTAATTLGIYATLVGKARESLIFWTCAFGAAIMATLATGGTGGLVVLLAPIFSGFNAAVNVAACLYIRKRDMKQVAVAEPTFAPEPEPN